MIPRVLAVIAALIACTGQPGRSPFVDDSASDGALVGAWDARLSLTHPYPLGLDSPVARRICGTIGFVENHRSSDPAPATPAVGVYDLDLSRLGLNWLDEHAFPAAVVSGPGDASSSSSSAPRGSITITLNPGSSERIVLLGRHDATGIDGEWTAQSARGTARGSFSLRPHNPVGRSC